MVQIFGKIGFDSDKHEYFLTDTHKKIKSVTQVIRYLSYDQANGAMTFMRDIAAERGTRIHEACLAYDFEGDFLEIEDDIYPYVQAYADFLRDYKAEWLNAEVIVFGFVNDLMVAGTIDRVGEIDGRKVVVDIKTGSKIHKIPVSAQTYAYAKLYGDDDLDIAVLHLKKDGTYEFSYLDKSIGEKAFGLCAEIEQLTYRRKKNDD